MEQKKKSLDLAFPKTIIEKCMFYMILGSELSVETLLLSLVMSAWSIANTE